jgi:hypothetical protein
MAFNINTKWSQLADSERALLWEKYSTLIKQRATNAYNWGSLFVKTTIAINAGALAVAVAFLGNVTATSDALYADYRYVLYKFVAGLAAATFLLLLATIKTYQDLCNEVEFFSEMVRDVEDISLTGRPTGKLGMHISWGVVFGVLAGAFSIAFFAWGIHDGAELIASIRKSTT